MNLKRRCCCPGVGDIARYLEVVPVIDIPADSYMYDNTKFFVDLGDDFEISDDLLLYAGGSASTAQVPIRLGYLEEFVPDRGIQCRFADGEISSGNLGEIGALRYRGWRVKDGGLRFTQAEFITGDFSDMTRIVMDLPGSRDDDLIQQVEGGGFFFLGGQFGNSPALIQERSSVDQDGNPVTYHVAFVPRTECSKPEQGRTYGNDAKRLVFDFTTQFPNSITLNFTYKGESSGQSFNYQITRTYEKFVSGSGLFPEAITLENPGSLPYRNVSGFVQDDPSDSAFLLFGYKAIDCTELQDDQVSSGPKIPISAPCMPIKYYSFGSVDSFFHGPVGEVRFFSGDPAAGFISLTTDANEIPGFAGSYVPHRLDQPGIVTTDVTIGPDNPDLRTDFVVPGFVIGSAGAGNQNPPSGSIPFTAMSYKAGVALENNYTMSIEGAFAARPALRRGNQAQFPFSNVTIRGLTESGLAYGSADCPLITLDAITGSIRLELMTNPLGGGYHFLTDGMTQDSHFVFPMTLPTTVSQS